ncbi:GNAT family N-acetyltransferase [Leifsonia sp. F6_8S_P_1B]|uniref:GNAT family N-acetyltransferase n=1 Tax=Leifsonia williamsii TaxID=3035919 RepID=A0ABT8K7E1_9MICO|nr:GNAT family N-acetyltransferase [Leifsonia williamsii]MDN4613370.1 GNAT family N-acetyltransferase [Leifsonia williamsii]
MDAFPLRIELPGHPGATLRRLERDDRAIELALARVPDVPPRTMYPADLDDAGARLRAERNVAAAEAGSGIRYVIDDRGSALGTAGMGRSDVGFEVFYALLPEGRGRGLATAAVRALASWLADQGEKVLWLSTLVGNDASEAVAERCGFTRDHSGTHLDGRPLTAWRLSLRPPHASEPQADTPS